MPGSLEIIARNLIAATCEADAPFSVNTALYPPSSLTLSPRSARLSRCFFGDVSQDRGRSPCAMGNEPIFRPSSLVEPTSDLSLTFLTSQAGRHLFHLSHFWWATSLTSEKFIAPFTRDGLLHHTVGHVSCSEMWSCLFDFSSVPVLLLTFSFSFPKAFEYRHSIKFPPAFLVGKHTAIEGTTHCCSSFGDHLEVFCTLGWNVEVSFSSASFLESGLCFVPGCYLLLLLWCLGSSGPFFGPDRIGSCSVLDTCGWTGHTMCILLEALSSLFGNELFQSIPLRGRLISHHSNDHSAYVRRRNRCFSSLASPPTCLHGMEKVVSPRMYNFARCT